MSSRVVYSSDRGRVCPRCGWPADDCRCSGKSAQQAVPSRVVAKLRIEKSGRSGKTVTVVDGLPQNSEFLKQLAQDLKRACGTGGTVFETGIELQGDLRERVRVCLVNKGFVVKG
jgi:translation initiation factor 1